MMMLGFKVKSLFSITLGREKQTRELTQCLTVLYEKSRILRSGECIIVVTTGKGVETVTAGSY